VDDAVGVGGGQRRGDGADDADRRREGQRGSAAEPRFEILTVEVLHHEVGAAVRGGVEVEELHDVRVPQLRHDFGLAAEAGERLVVRQQIGQQDLHREAAGEPDVRGLVDLTHAAEPDPAQQAVAVSEDRAGGLARYSLVR
jgi:hypothetical protein